MPRPWPFVSATVLDQPGPDRHLEHRGNTADQNLDNAEHPAPKHPHVQCPDVRGGNGGVKPVLHL